MNKPTLKSLQRLVFLGAFILSLLYFGTAAARPVPQGVSITAQVQLSSLSIAPKGIAFQTAIIRLRDEEAFVTGLDVTDGALPLTSLVSNTGDSLTIESQVTGNNHGAAAGLLLEINLDLSNNSTLDTYRMLFQTRSEFALNASGSDAVADIHYALLGVTGQNIIFDPWKLVADSYFDIQPSPVDRSDDFHVDLAPGDTARLTFLIDLQGDTDLFYQSEQDDQFDGSVSFELVLNEVQLEQTDAEVNPIPTLTLWGLVLLAFLLVLLIVYRTKSAGMGGRS